MRARLLLVLVLALVLAGCGTTKTVTRTVTAPTKAPHGGVVNCTPQDQAMQCFLPAPGRLLGLPQGGRVYALGVDFAWGAPTVATMRRLGKRFGASYLSYDSAKGWVQRPGLVSSYHAAGIATVSVWETTANRAGQGYGAGHADAIEARRQAAQIGNTAATIDFAIDFDASGESVAGYFRGVHDVLGARAGAYGGYYPLKYLCAHGLIRKAWQTYAWSGGQWLPASCAPLEQYLNDGTVDYDRAIAADYGQWPHSGGPTPAQKRAAKRHSLTKHEAERRVLHGLINRHHCRKGQHTTPRQPIATRKRYHDALCPRWLTRGRSVTGTSKRLRRELHAGPLPILR